MHYCKYFLIIILLQCSCKKWVTVDPPDHQLVAAVVYTTDLSATSAVTGLYAQLIQGNNLFASSALTLYPAMSADEIRNRTTGTNDEFSQNKINPSNFIVQTNIWSWAYNYLYQANSIIEGVSQSTTLSTVVKNQLLGEAKTLRAFCYFYLVNLFGDVPLITGTEYQKNATQARTNITAVYQQIVDDLTSAQSLLVPNYPTAGKVRINKWTATALLARAYLYQKNYAGAEAAATTVINSGLYNVNATPLDKVFLANSNESIWQLMPVATNANTWDGANFIPATNTAPTYLVLPGLLNAFEPGDGRKTAWLASTTIGTTVYTYPFKYKVRNATTVTEYYTVFRLAEQYLVRAEARAFQNNFTGAKQDIDIIRARAGLLPTTAASLPQLQTAIAQERQVELFAEWGHRWFDLKRTGQADAILGAVKGANWQSTDALYPIPLSQIQSNPALSQNPGY